MSRGSIYLPTTTAETESKRSGAKWPFAVLAGILTYLVLSTSPSAVTYLKDAASSVSPKMGAAAHDAAMATLQATCVQPVPTLPHTYNVSKVLGEKERIIKWLSGAVQIPTEIFDEMGPVEEDPKWKPLIKFQEFLEESFPLVHKTLDKSVHDWALVYEWPGSDSSLKPLFLTAHQDVVPVLPSTLSQWDQPPYSGHYDGKFIWGRGASDTKSSLIAIMGAIEHLLETTDFKPKRSIVLGFGSDEERGGQVGAPAISKYLVNKYGKDSMSLLIDEGSGLQNTWGQQFALPAVAEKGHYDLGITVQTLGGHSSVPPPHTGIGYMSLLLAELEKNPHPVTLGEASPLYGYATCAASYAKDIPHDLKRTVLKTVKGHKQAWSDLPAKLIETGSSPRGAGQGNVIQAMMTTTQAADIIAGGLKVNALPEDVKAVVNHRVNVDSNAAELEQQTIKTLLPVVKSYNLTLVGFDGKTVFHGAPFSKVILNSAYGYYTDPSPRSPTDASDPKSAYTILASTARGMWASRKAVSADGEIVELESGKDLVMAPFMSTGNTDTRRYWDLTKNIYRFRYSSMEDAFGAHTINERIGADNVVEFTRWYQAIILAMDQAENIA